MDDYSTLFNTLSQTAALNNAWSADQALNQMAFQRMMSNTAHQREIADLKAAGLNPILSAKLGGASTPSGAMGTTDTSLVSSMVQLMDKMLDVQGTSAEAVSRSSGGYYGTYPNSGDNSGSTITSSDMQGTLGLLGLKIPASVADVAASFLNGIRGVDNGKNKSTAVYDFALDHKDNGGSLAQQYVKAYNEGNFGTSNNIVNTVSNAISNVGKTITSAISNILPSSAKTASSVANSPSKKTSSSSTSTTKTVVQKAKATVSNAVRKVKNLFKK